MLFLCGVREHLFPKECYVGEPYRDSQAWSLTKRYSINSSSIVGIPLPKRVTRIVPFLRLYFVSNQRSLCLIWQHRYSLKFSTIR